MTRWGEALRLRPSEAFTQRYSILPMSTISPFFHWKEAMNSYKRDVYGKAIKVAANGLVLAAVAVGMYQASYFPETFLAVFCQWFFAMLAGILGLCWLSMRTLRHRYPVEEHADLSLLSVVNLPRQGPRLVQWHVLYSPSQRRREASAAFMG